MAKRFDLEELRSLASVIVQAERIGSSVSEALQVFADTLRLRRHQRAEEMAQKAAGSAEPCALPSCNDPKSGPGGIPSSRAFSSSR